MKNTLAYRWAAAVADGKHSFTYKGTKYNCHVGELMKKSVARFFADLDAKKFELKPDLGYIPINFIENFLHHWKGLKAGEKFRLEPWQHFYFMNLFGWVNDEGMRRFNRSYLEVARKNGKTSMSACLAVCHVTIDSEQGMQCYVGATREEQARITVNDAGRIIEKSPLLKGVFDVRTYHGQISRVFNKKNLAFIAPLGRDSRTQDGFDPSMGIIDEYHEHKDTATIDVIESGMVARREPLLPIITTAGFNKVYPCYRVTRKSAVEVLNGQVENDSYFYMVFTMDEGDDMENPDLWIKANPNLGVSVIKDQLKKSFDNAKTEGGPKWTNFLTKNLNIWTDAPEFWIRDDVVRENNHGITEKELEGRDCYFGVDLASTEDMTCVSVFFPNVRDGIHAFKNIFFVPQAGLTNRKDNMDQTFREWKNEGWIRIAGEDANDYTYQVKVVLDELKKYNPIKGGYDRYMANSGFVRDVLSGSSDPEFILPIHQGPGTMSEPTRWLHSQVLERKCDLLDNPVTRWQFGNVVLVQDQNGNVKPSKGKSENKIDGIMAMLNAIAVYLDDSMTDNSSPLFFTV